MTSLLTKIASLLIGSVLGYMLGVRQGQKQTQYDHKSEAITELRRRLREIRDGFIELSARPEFRLDDWPNRPTQAKELGEKLASLENYYRDQAAWLDVRTLEKVDNVTDVFVDKWSAFENLLEINTDAELVAKDPKAPYDEKAAAKTLWDWSKHDAGDLLIDLDDEFFRSLSVHMPWWRRWFGG